MRMKHIMVEGYCSKDVPGDKYPCKSHGKKIGVYCLECTLFSYTKCPLEIAHSNEDSIIECMEDFVSLNIEDIDVTIRNKKISKWNQICKTKIAEAYNEYLKWVEEEKDNKEV